MGKTKVELDKQDIEFINMCIRFYQDQTGTKTEHSKELSERLTGIWLELELEYLKDRKDESEPLR